MARAAGLELVNTSAGRPCHVARATSRDAGAGSGHDAAAALWSMAGGGAAASARRSSVRRAHRTESGSPGRPPRGPGRRARRRRCRPRRLVAGRPAVVVAPASVAPRVVGWHPRPRSASRPASAVVWSALPLVRTTAPTAMAATTAAAAGISQRLRRAVRAGSGVGGGGAARAVGRRVVRGDVAAVGTARAALAAAGDGRGSRRSAPAPACCAPACAAASAAATAASRAAWGAGGTGEPGLGTHPRSAPPSPPARGRPRRAPAPGVAEAVEHGAGGSSSSGSGGSVMAPRFDARRGRSGSRPSSAQRGPAAGDAGAHRAGGDPERLGDLGVLEVAQVAQHHRGAELLRQAGQRVVDGHPVRDLGRAGGTVAGRLDDQLDRRRSAPAPAELVEADVGGDPVHPGREGRAAVEAVQAPHDGDQRLLRGVLGVAAVAEELGRQSGRIRSYCVRSSSSSALVARLRGNDQRPTSSPPGPRPARR